MRARLATEKPAVLRRHMPVWTVREAAACGLTEAERAAIVGRHVVSVYRDAPGYQVNARYAVRLPLDSNFLRGKVW